VDEQPAVQAPLWPAPRTTAQAAALARSLWDADPFVARVLADTVERARAADAALAVHEAELVLSGGHPLSDSARRALDAADEAEAALLGVARWCQAMAGRR
jgi:hypothetical protein